MGSNNLDKNLVDKIKSIDIGNQVICDICNTDYTDDLITQGGILFGSKAVCPSCSPGLEESAKKYGEEDYITERCPAGMTFREWCLKLRDGNNTINIYEMNFE